MTEKVRISFQVTREMLDGLETLAKEYNISLSTLVRNLVSEGLDDDIVDDTAFRPRKVPEEKT